MPGNDAPAGPDTHSFPRPRPFEKRRAHLPEGRGQLGRASRPGRVVGRWLLPSGAAARRGSGGLWDGASAPSPLSLRQPRADLVLSPDPPPRRGRSAANGKKRARPASHPTVRLPGLLPRTYLSGLDGPLTTACHRTGLAPSAPVRHRLAGRPAASMSHEALDIKDLLGMEHVVESPAQLVGQRRQRLGLAQTRRQPLQQAADAFVLLGAEHGRLAEGPLQPGVAGLATCRRRPVCRPTPARRRTDRA